MATLTPQQYIALKNDITADVTLNALTHTPDNSNLIAYVYNTTTGSTPPVGNIIAAFTVWKTSVPIDQVGMNFNGNDLAGLTTANNSRLQTLALYLDVVNPSLANSRQFFDDVFSGAGGATTRANLLILWKRLATRIEKLFANTSGGNGADATPALLVFEGVISCNDVVTAWNS